ncbi:hypothetical protein I4U23_028915 [Adineta vaga]|nr:hypothetical protein I4U23_028915 [Adineta vaga]
MHRFQFYLLTTILIIFLVIDVYHHINANPAENSAQPPPLTTQTNEHKSSSARVAKYPRIRPFLLPFPPSPFIEQYPEYL